jgi:plasmid stability protein
MPQLLVRDVPLGVVEALKRRAAEHGRSAEAEHRIILEEALRAKACWILGARRGASR